MSRAQYRVIQAAERAGIGLLQVEWKVCSVCKTCVGTQCVCVIQGYWRWNVVGCSSRITALKTD